LRARQDETPRHERTVAGLAVVEDEHAPAAAVTREKRERRALQIVRRIHAQVVAPTGRIERREQRRIDAGRLAREAHEGVERRDHRERPAARAVELRHRRDGAG